MKEVGDFGNPCLLPFFFFFALFEGHFKTWKIINIIKKIIGQKKKKKKRNFESEKSGFDFDINVLFIFCYY